MTTPEQEAQPRAVLSHLQRLEAESIHIMREAVAESERPVMLYSIGKDSSVMLHLARKAFYPSPPPFPLRAQPRHPPPFRNRRTKTCPAACRRMREGNPRT